MHYFNSFLKSCASIALILASTNLYAATYYVALDGSDSAAGSSSAPFQTIGHGISNLSSGDTLIVRDGVYEGKDNFITGMPSGTPSNYTEVRAETPLKVRIINNGSLNYYDHIIRIQNNYVKVDGFISEIVDTNYPPFVASVTGNYNKVTRSIFKRKGNVDQYGGWLSLGGNYNLAEDVAGVGSARYGFYTGSSNASVNHNIFRRAVGRIDYTESTQPKAVFAMYGNNSGTGAEFHLFQNCIAIDSHRGPRSPQETYGGFYFPKNAKDVTIQGSIALNNDVAYAGYFIKEQKGYNITIEDSVSWGNYNTSNNVAGVRFGGSVGPVTVDNVTIGGHSAAFYINSYGEMLLSDTLGYYSSRETNNDTWTNKTNNQLFNMSSNYPIPNFVQPNTSTGADLTKRYGVDGTLWGESGYNQKTEQDLWPWPYENIIKEVFSEENTPPSGVTPSTNNTIRGFTQTGLDAWGKPITLTRYIWQYLGNEIPVDIYDVKVPPRPPSNITGTVIN